MVSRVHVGVAVGGVAAAFGMFMNIAIAFAILAARGDAAIALPNTRLDLLASALTIAPAWQVFGTLGTFAASVFGGYVAAAIARERTVLVGLLSTWLTVGLGVRSWVLQRSAMSASEFVVVLASHAVVGLAGAWLWRVWRGPSHGEGARLTRG